MLLLFSLPAVVILSALWPPAREEKLPFSLARVLLCGPLQTTRGRKEAGEVSLACKSTSLKENTREHFFFIARAVSHFFSSFVVVVFFSLSPFPSS